MLNYTFKHVGCRAGTGWVDMCRSGTEWVDTCRARDVCWHIKVIWIKINQNTALCPEYHTIGEVNKEFIRHSTSRNYCTLLAHCLHTVLFFRLMDIWCLTRSGCKKCCFKLDTHRSSKDDLIMLSEQWSIWYFFRSSFILTATPDTILKQLY